MMKRPIRITRLARLGIHPLLILGGAVLCTYGIGYILSIIPNIELKMYNFDRDYDALIFMFIVGFTIFFPSMILLYFYSVKINLAEAYYNSHFRAENFSGDFFLTIRSFGKSTFYINKQERYIRAVDQHPPPDIAPYEGRGGGEIHNLILEYANFLDQHGFGMLVVMGGDIEIGGNIPNNIPLYVDSREDDWKENFELLAKSCRAIIAFPELSLGFQYEINYLLRQELIRKTIFVMPPMELSYLNQYSGDQEYSPERSERWKDIAKGFAEVGINLPNYDPDGKLFILDKESKITTQKSIKESLMFSFGNVLRTIESPSEPLNIIYPRIKFRRDYRDTFKLLDDVPGYESTSPSCISLLFIILGIIVFGISLLYRFPSNTEWLKITTAWGIFGIIWIVILFRKLVFD